MPNRLVSLLRTAFIALMMAYVGLMVSTVYFAAKETDLRQAIHDTEASIARLEARYFDSVEEIAAMNPTSMGLGAPAGKRYAKEVQAPTLSLLVE